MGENSFKGTVESLFKGMEGFITSKTVVGDAVKFDDGTIILPLVDVSFGVGAGAFSAHEGSSNKDNGAGAIGGKVQPSAILVIKDGITKVLDMVPDVINKFSSKKGKKEEQGEEELIDEDE